MDGVHSEKDCILFIDDDCMSREMLCNIFAERYVCEQAENGLEGLQKIEALQSRLCAVLLDVAMPVMDGMALLRVLNARGITNKIPVFLLTVSTEQEVVQEGYELGVMDVITKPIAPFVILRRIQNLIELFQTRETLCETVLGQAQKLKESINTIDTLHRNTIEALASAIEFRDVESGEHTNRIYSVTKHILSNTEFGKGLSESEIENIAVASIMHDVGKIAISDVILNKPGRLTSDEFEVMKTHTTKGEMLMRQIARTQNHDSYLYASDIARHHHERWDGGGYPDKLKGDEISVWAQVVSIADVYDALLSPRVYKKAYDPDMAVNMIINGECGVFNPQLLQSFLSVEADLRKWYVSEKTAETLEYRQYGETLESKERKDGLEAFVSGREVVDVLLLVAAVQSVYDMIICVNLSKNSYYMMDYDRFLTHVAGYDGVFDDLILAGASAVPESHRQMFLQTFKRESLLEAYNNGKKSVYLEHPQFADNGVEHMVATSVLFVEDPKTGDLLEITLSRYIDDEWEEKEKTKRILGDALLVAESANSAKSDFLSRMSHDIRTPLNAIIGMTTIIAANCDNPEKVMDGVAKIGISSKYLLGLINDILDFSKMENGSLPLNIAEFDIRNMVEEIRVIIGERASAKNQSVEFSVDEAVAQCYKGDAFRIRQVLINLLDNAYKYTPEGGTYSLRIQKSGRARSHRFLEFVVEDNGVGIPEENLENIFAPFVQYGDSSINNGVGLGLAITRNLVHLMNGEMQAESTVGVGTKFTVTLPLALGAGEKKRTKKAAEPTSATEVLKPVFHGEKILVAEDNELNQEIVKTILEMENLQVTVVANGKEAVDAFVSSKPGEYAMIFMDVSMPVMNGYEATKHIRSSAHEEAMTIPIYALTANAFDTDVLEAKNSGMDGHIAKPIDFEEVSKVLTQTIAVRKKKE